MAEETGAPQTNLVSAPIIPSLPEIEASKDPFGSLHTPSPVIMPFNTTIGPVIPNGVPKNIDINNQLQGDFHSGPNPGAKPANTKGGTLDYVKAVSDYMKDDKAVADRYKYGRSYSYGAGYKNANFDRYYQHGKFNELGFSPYRDNEALYNERGSWWDDFSRMTTQWGGLAWGGFKSIWGTEQEANETMEKGMAIGQSTRGGFGGWVTNFSLNSAYTIGVMGEIILEDIGLLALEGLTGGAATPAVGGAAIARNTMAFGRLYKAWSGMGKFMKGLKSVDQVKDFYNASKMWDRTVDFAKFINPAQRSMDQIMDVYRGSKGMNSLGSMAQVTKSFGQFYRDFREMNVALSEAMLEGEGASVNYQNQLLDEFYALNGRMPEGKEADEIFEKAQSIKATVGLANMATIYYSNKLVFEDLFEGFRPGSKVADLFLEGTGRYLKRAPAQTFKAGTTAAVEAGVKTGAQKTKDFLLKSPYLPWSRKYFVGNLGEALQESSQEVIQVSALDYYNKISSDPTQAHFYSAIASIGAGISDQFSAKGLDTFIQGYLMGSLIQGTGAAGKGIVGKIRGTSAEAKAEAEKVDNNILNAANHIADNALVFGDDMVTMAGAVKTANQQKKKAVAEGDQKTANDMTDEVQIQYFHTLARSKNMGLVTGHVDDMLTLSDKDLADAYNLTEADADGIRKKLTTLKDRAEGYQRKYDYAKRRLANPYNPWMIDPKKNKAAYDNEYAKYAAHENAVANLLFATEDYERITGRMQSIGANLSGQTNMFQSLVNVIKGGTPVANAAAPEVSLLVDHVQRAMTMNSLKDQIKVLNMGTAQQKKEAEGLQEQLELLQEWNEVADHYVREMNSDRKAQTSPQESEERQRVSKIRAGAVVKDKSGEEYTIESVKAGKATVRSKTGQKKRINRKNLQLVKEAKQGEFDAIEGDDLSFSIAELYKVYDKYLRSVAKMKKGYVFNEQLNEAFRQIKDYYHLERDAAAMVHTINVLSDPEYFERYVEIQTKVEEMKKIQKLENLKKALEKSREMIGQNAFLNEIYDLGVFVLPEDVDKLKDFSVVDFYNQTTKQLVDKESELYAKILAVIEKYNPKPKEETVTAESKETTEVKIEAPARGPVLSPGEKVTNSTPIDVLKNTPSTRPLLEDLVRAYRAYREEMELAPVELEFDALITTEDFRKFFVESGTASEIVRKFNEGRIQEVVKPSVTKAASVNIWAPGNRKIFTGMDMGGIQHTEIPIEVLEYNEEIDSEGELVKAVIAKNLDTGEQILLDINSEQAVDFKYKALDKTTTSAAVSTISKEKPTVTPSEAAKVRYFGTPANRMAKVEKEAANRNLTQQEINEIELIIEKAKEVGWDKDRLFRQLSSMGFTYAFGVQPEGFKNYLEDRLSGKTNIRVTSEYNFFQQLDAELAALGSVVEKPATGITIEGSKLSFTGRVSIEGSWRDEMLTDVPVEVIKNHGYHLENDWGSHGVTLRRLDTGKNISIDLESANAVKYKYRALTPEELLMFTPKPLPTEHKGVPIVEDNTIKSAVGEPGAAKYDRKNNVIRLNPVLMREKYAQKAWTKPLVQRDKSIAKALPENIFGSYEEFERFVIEHEWQHSQLDYGKFSAANPDPNYGKYEDEINTRALRELGLLEKDTTDSTIMVDYNNIQGKADLDNWRKDALEVVSSSSLRDKVSNQLGVEFNSDYVKKLVADKERDLAMNINFENLLPGTVVVMKNGKTMVVKSKNDKEVFLVTPETYRTGDPTGKIIRIHKDVLTKEIKMKHSEFMDKAEKEQPLTSEEVKDSEVAVNNAKDMDDPDKIAKEIEESLDKKPEDLDDALGDAINNCKIKPD